jgi:TIR domain
MSPFPTGSRRFDIALSFPGEHRGFVEDVASHLSAAFGRERVLYDKYYEAEFARPNLDIYLPQLYRTESELVVLFLCPEYAAKRWCNLEWRFIRDMLASIDEARIMFLRHGYDGDLTEHGILRADGMIDFSVKSAAEIAQLIEQRFHLNRGTTPPPPPRQIPVDIDRIGKHVPQELVGRETETALLDAAWAEVETGAAGRPHVLTIVGIGGEGKTSLVASWAAGLAVRDWPGCEAAFAWSFYDQGAQEGAADSSDFFLKAALDFFGDPDTAGSARSAFDKGKRLAQLAGAKRALLLLDGVEPLQYPPTSPMAGKFKDSGLEALLKSLAASSRGLCLVTTRASVEHLRHFRLGTAPEITLDRLSTRAGADLLRRLGVRGAEPAFGTLVEDVKGHALTLTLLASFLRDAFAGDIRKRNQVRLEDADEEQGGHAFRVMDAYVRWFESGGPKGARALAVLRLLGLFDRPADAACLAALWCPPAIPSLTEPLVPLGDSQRNLALAPLEAAKLVTAQRDGAGTLRSLDAHPLLRDYFARTLRRDHPEAWRVAHRRIYEHLCTATEDKPQPTLEDLQPLYQAVYHGCLAGLQQDALDRVYLARIVRRNEFYSTNKLGAVAADIGAVAHFFDQSWSRISPALTPADQPWLVSVAAFRLRALGRLTESVEPMRAALAMVVERQDWRNAAVSAANLSELELSLGALGVALTSAHQAVVYADKSDDAFERLSTRTTLADALHHAGRGDEAAALFRTAEEMQAAWQTEYPLLYSLRGFEYCDLLLAGAEAAAWRSLLDVADPSRPSSLQATCREVADRAARALQVATSNSWLLDIALDHLTLGRAALYETLLGGGSGRLPDSCRTSLQTATDGLRRAGSQDHLPRGLLSRAWLRCLDGDWTGPDSAEADLDEAFEIGLRGPMPLYLADIHLYRARLFGLRRERPAHYPWDSWQTDLGEARRLIEQHGYWRRKQELEDAEEAAARR